MFKIYIIYKYPKAFQGIIGVVVSMQSLNALQQAQWEKKVHNELC